MEWTIYLLVFMNFSFKITLVFSKLFFFSIELVLIYIFFASTDLGLSKIFVVDLGLNTSEVFYIEEASKKGCYNISSIVSRSWAFLTKILEIRSFAFSDIPLSSGIL